MHFRNENSTIVGPKKTDRNNYDVGILLNSCDQGYGIFNMDNQTVFFIEKHLGDIFNYF